MRKTQTYFYKDFAKITYLGK